MHCGDAEALAIIDKQVTEFCLTEAARIGQNSLKNGLKVAWRTGDRAEYLGGSGLSLQCLGKVLPSLGKFVPVFLNCAEAVGGRIHLFEIPNVLRPGRCGQGYHQRPRAVCRGTVRPSILAVWRLMTSSSMPRPEGRREPRPRGGSRGLSASSKAAQPDSEQFRSSPRTFQTIWRMLPWRWGLRWRRKNKKIDTPPNAQT